MFFVHSAKSDSQQRCFLYFLTHLLLISFSLFLPIRKFWKEFQCVQAFRLNLELISFLSNSALLVKTPERFLLTFGHFFDPVC